MGMMMVQDQTQKRLNKYKKRAVMRKLHPKGKITHSMVIDAALDAFDESLDERKSELGAF